MADDFEYTELLPLDHADHADQVESTPYRLITTDGVSTFETPEGTFLKVAPEAIRRLTAEAMHDIAHFLRPRHLQQLIGIASSRARGPRSRPGNACACPARWPRRRRH